MPDTMRGGAASDLLRDLAERTVHGPEPRGTGRYHHVHTFSTYLRRVRTAGSRERRGVVERAERRQWIAADGSGRLLVIQNGQSVQPSGHYAPGRLVAAFVTATDPAALTARLRARNPERATSTAVRTFAEIWKNQVVPPALQRLLLLDLAGHPDLSVDGVPLTLPDGRAVALGHVDREQHTRHLLVFDQETGALIGEDVTALDGADVPVPTPATTSSTEWSCSGYTTTTGTSPE